MVEVNGNQMDLMDKRRKRRARGLPGVHYNYAGPYVLPQVGVGWGVVNWETGQIGVVDPGSGSESGDGGAE